MSLNICSMRIIKFLCPCAKLYNTFVFNAACDEITTRGWIVDLETSKHEEVIL